MFEKIEAAAWPDALSDDPALTQKAIEAYDAAKALLQNGGGDAGYAIRGIMAAIVESMVDFHAAILDEQVFVVEGTRRSLYEAVDRLLTATYPAQGN